MDVLGAAKTALFRAGRIPIDEKRGESPRRQMAHEAAALPQVQHIAAIDQRGHH